MGAAQRLNRRTCLADVVDQAGNGQGLCDGGATGAPWTVSLVDAAPTKLMVWRGGEDGLGQGPREHRRPHRVVTITVGDQFRRRPAAPATTGLTCGAADPSYSDPTAEGSSPWRHTQKPSSV